MLRQVEFLETYGHGTEVYVAGDRKSFPKAEADVFISIGVAKCVESGEQNERKPGAHVIDVQGVVQSA
jgi:hypothetical protein